jgi:hypothetical protein
MGGGRPLASLVGYNPGSRVASWIYDGLSDHNIGTPGGLRLRNIVEKSHVDQVKCVQAAPLAVQEIEGPPELRADSDRPAGAMWHRAA